MKALRGQLNPENVLPTLDKVWQWTRVAINETAVVNGVGKTTADATPKETAPKPPPMNPAFTISQAQQRRLFAIAKTANMTAEAVKEFLMTYYGIESSKDIPKKQYEEICMAIQTGEFPR